MTANIMTGALAEYLRKDDTESIRTALESEHAADVANDIGGLAHEQCVRVLLLLSPRKQAQVFGYFDPESQVAMARGMPRASLATLITHMSHDERADLFNRLTPEQREALLPGLAQAEREDIRRLAAYEEGTAGALMTSDYANLSPELSVREALDKLRQEAPDKETIYDAFVLDSERRLIGVVSLRDLLLADPTSRIDALMTRQIVQADAGDPREEVARKIAEYDLRALPIVNGDGKLVGIVTQDDAMDVSEEEASELMYRKAGIADPVHATEIIRSAKLTQGAVWYPVRVRLLFLLITLAGGLAVGTLIDHFEDVLESIIAVAIFIPLIMDMGGNVGTQSTTIFARGLALGHIDLSRFGRVLRRELGIGVIMGVIIGIVAGVIAYYWQGVPNDVPQLGIAVGIALFTSVSLACVLGFVLPWTLVKLGFDHAPGADPFITTIKDFSGLAVYFLLVAWLLGIEIGA